MSANIDIRGLRGDGGSPTVTTSMMIVHFTDTGKTLDIVNK